MQCKDEGLGMSLIESALEASQLRLRPILMTSFAFIVGLLPLTWVRGGSALGNRSIGTGAVGGMLTGVILGVFIIPVLFVIFQYLQERSNRRAQAKSPGSFGIKMLQRIINKTMMKKIDRKQYIYIPLSATPISFPPAK